MKWKEKHLWKSSRKGIILVTGGGRLVTERESWGTVDTRKWQTQQSSATVARFPAGTRAPLGDRWEGECTRYVAGDTVVGLADHVQM